MMVSGPYNTRKLLYNPAHSIANGRHGLDRLINAETVMISRWQYCQVSKSFAPKVSFALPSFMTNSRPSLDPLPTRSQTLPPLLRQSLLQSTAHDASPVPQKSPVRSQTSPAFDLASLYADPGGQTILTPFSSDSTEPLFDKSLYAGDIAKDACDFPNAHLSSNEMRPRSHIGTFTPNRAADTTPGPSKRKFSAIGPSVGSGWRKAVAFLETHWLVTTVFSMLVIIGISIGVGWGARLHTFDAEDGESVPPDNTIILSANLISVDPMGQTITLDWFVNFTCGFSNCPDVNIFFDQNTLQQSGSSSNSVASNTKPSPVFLLNGTNFVNYWDLVDFRPSSLTFRTDLTITSHDTGRTQQSYPFDKYIVQMSIFAETVSGNNPVNVTVYQTTGIAVGFNAQLLDSGKVDEFGTLYKFIEVTRGQVIRVYAIFIVMAIWLVTLTFIGFCFASVFYGKGVSAAVLVLPVATLFAFTALRGTLPGAPNGFGADIDFVGILPCLALLTFCSVFMTAIFLFRNPEVDSTRWLSTQSV